ncbi:hypothetical protein BC828DRAFT_376711 [Blastocladiella britannica]|nr:hypothetical protein BC828DRAFT_376711 [Blastocladiella britannica]
MSRLVQAGLAIKTAVITIVPVLLVLALLALICVASAAAIIAGSTPNTGIWTSTPNDPPVNPCLMHWISSAVHSTALVAFGVGALFRVFMHTYLMHVLLFILFGSYFYGITVVVGYYPTIVPSCRVANPTAAHLTVGWVILLGVKLITIGTMWTVMWWWERRKKRVAAAQLAGHRRDKNSSEGSLHEIVATA